MGQLSGDHGPCGGFEGAIRTREEFISKIEKHDSIVRLK